MNRIQTGKKTESNQKKPSQTKKWNQTGKNRAKQVEPVFVLKKPNQTKTGLFEPVLVWFN